MCSHENLCVPALFHFVLGLDLDQPARIDLVANRRELRDRQIVVEARYLPVFESLPQPPVELRLQVLEAVGVVGPRTHVERD
jgi:hypothetical protein